MNFQIQSRVLFDLDFIPYDMDNIPGKPSNRVFVGGAYKNIAVLREISTIILGLGYVPILAANFLISKKDTRSDTLRLLHSCRTAVFEISFRNGHNIEIEKTKEFGINTILVYQIIDRKKSVDPEITSMLDIYQYPIYGYRNFEELKKYLLTSMMELIF